MVLWASDYLDIVEERYAGLRSRVSTLVPWFSAYLHVVKERYAGVRGVQGLNLSTLGLRLP